MNAILYDCEIMNCIPHHSEIIPWQGLDYCQGWDDFAGMGISCVCAIDLQDNLPRIFLPDNLSEFSELISRPGIRIIGFNSRSFDDRLCQANGIDVKTDYDLLEEIRFAAGYPREYTPGVTPKGYNLDALAKANGFPAKSGRGDLAPVWAQTGQIGRLVDYCLRDVTTTLQIWSSRSALTDPRTGRTLNLMIPPWA